MKLKHPTHDPKPMDALSYYLQVQREYALAREGYLRIDEADDTYNDLNRKIIDAYRERYGTAYLGRINYSGNQRQRIADGTLKASLKPIPGSRSITFAVISVYQLQTVHWKN